MGVLSMERRDRRQGAVLRAWLDTRLIPTFASRLLQIDLSVAKRCAALHVPTTRPVHDAFIAATALVHDKIVVTRNEADFAPMGVRLFNPWRDGAA